MKVFSKEAIAFQPASAPKTLANELTAIFQDVIDYRNKITSSDSERVQAVKDYFMKKAAVEVLRTIGKYTGMKMKMVVPSSLIANWAIGMTFEDDKSDGGVELVIRRYSGLIGTKQYEAYVKYLAGKVKTQADLEELSKSLNTETGFVHTAIMEKHNFRCKLYFDVYASFLIKEMGAKACEPLTAKEITAVVLHEIGHALSFIEHAADICFKKDVMALAIKNFEKNASDKEKAEYVSKMIGSMYPEMGEAVKRLSDYVATQKQQKGNIVYSGIRILLNTALAIIITLGLGAYNLITNTVRNIWNATLGGDIKSIKELGNTKSSDFAMTSTNDAYCEILADEYVTRFGYGGHFASQLKKVMSWSRITGLGDMRMAQFSSVSFFGRLLPWAILTSLYGDRYCKDYPDEKRRYELLLIDTLKAFKDSNLDPNLLADYYAAYRNIKSILDNPSRELRYARFWNCLHEVVNYIVKTPESLLFTGRFDEEYERLYNRVQSLTNNELYALAYLLKNK